MVHLKNPHSLSTNDFEIHQFPGVDAHHNGCQCFLQWDSEKDLLLVNTIVRVDGSIKFDNSKAAQPKKGAKKVNLLLSEGEHNRVENCTNV